VGSHSLAPGYSPRRQAHTLEWEAFGGAMYGMDLLAAAALNRSKAHIAGFRTL